MFCLGCCALVVGENAFTSALLGTLILQCGLLALTTVICLITSYAPAGSLEVTAALHSLYYLAMSSANLGCLPGVVLSLLHPFRTAELRGGQTWSHLSEYLAPPGPAQDYWWWRQAVFSSSFALWATIRKRPSSTTLSLVSNLSFRRYRLLTSNDNLTAYGDGK